MAVSSRRPFSRGDRGWANGGAGTVGPYAGPAARRAAPQVAWMTFGLGPFQEEDMADDEASGGGRVPARGGSRATTGSAGEPAKKAPVGKTPARKAAPKKVTAKKEAALSKAPARKAP